MTTHSTIYVNNDALIELVGLTDGDGNVVTGASVSLTSFTDRLGNEVSGLTLPITLSHVSAGLYRGSISDAAAIVDGQIYKATIQAISGSLQGEWIEKMVAKSRHA